MRLQETEIMKKHINPIKLLIAIAVSALLSVAGALLGASTGLAAFSFLLTTAIVGVLLEHPDKPFSWKIVMVVIALSLNLGLSGIQKGIDCTVEWLKPAPPVEEGSASMKIGIFVETESSLW